MITLPGRTAKAAGAGSHRCATQCGQIGCRACCSTHSSRKEPPSCSLDRGVQTEIRYAYSARTQSKTYKAGGWWGCRPRDGPGTEESSPATWGAYRNCVEQRLRTDDRPRRAEHSRLQRLPLGDVLRTHDCALPRSVPGELVSLGAPIGFNPSLREGLVHTDAREKVRTIQEGKKRGGTWASRMAWFGSFSIRKRIRSL